MAQCEPKICREYGNVKQNNGVYITSKYISVDLINNDTIHGQFKALRVIGVLRGKLQRNKQRYHVL